MRTALITVAETAPFVARAKRRLTDEERHTLIDMIALNPECGVLIQGTGGIRKVRFAVGGKGKSGGVRIIYYYHNESIPVFLLDVFAKNEKANLTKAELNALADLVKLLKRYGET